MSCSLRSFSSRFTQHSSEPLRVAICHSFRVTLSESLPGQSFPFILFPVESFFPSHSFRVTHSELLFRFFPSELSHTHTRSPRPPLPEARNVPPDFPLRAPLARPPCAFPCAFPCTSRARPHALAGRPVTYRVTLMRGSAAVFERLERLRKVCVCLITLYTQHLSLSLSVPLSVYPLNASAHP